LKNDLSTVESFFDGIISGFFTWRSESNAVEISVSDVSVLDVELEAEPRVKGWPMLSLSILQLRSQLVDNQF